MNHIEFDAKRQRNIELLVLVIATLYAAGFGGLLMADRRAIWNLVVIVVSIVLMWTFYLIAYRTYRFRAYVTFGMFQMCMVLYMLQVQDVTRSFATMMVPVVMIALYGLPELVGVALAAYTFELAYHIFVTGQISFAKGRGDIRLAIQILSVYMVQFVVCYVICRQAASDQEQDARIEELKNAERSRDDFLANVSHEIRTPINTICGMSEAVLRENIPDHLREEVFSIQNAGQNLLSAVSDILDFSELESDSVELVEEEYNIASLANDVINLSVAKKEEKNIELVMDLDVTLPSGMIGDEQKIRRVVMNFVDNAIKFTSDGGVSIVFSCRREAYGVNLTVSVKDTGIGMKKEHLEKIFTSFSQIDSKRNRQEGGLGLGLAISRAIIAKMGGFISVNSEYGKGSQIQFTIPQRVVSWEPVASVRNAGAYSMAIYINMEQFTKTEIRDEYAAVIHHMVRQSGVSCTVCQNLQELKRRTDRENFTHVLISVPEYEEDRGFFDGLAKQAQVMVALDHNEEDRLSGSQLLRIYKPFFILPVIMALNGERTSRGVNLNQYRRGRFAAPKARILAVDDNRMNLKVLENLLKPYALQLVQVTSGAEALACIESRDFDFVFMDHMMPEMDGIETLKRIRCKQGDYYRTVPIVALTANAVSGMREMFLGEGFDAFLSKPVELSALERVLRRFIPAYKLVDKPEDESFRPASKDQAVFFQAAAAGFGQEPGGYAGNTPGNAAAHAGRTAETTAGNAAEMEAANAKAASGNAAAAPGTAANAGLEAKTLSGNAAAAPGTADRAENAAGPAARRQKKTVHENGGPDLKDLDVQKGILYCGGMDGYIEVLKMHCEDGDKNRATIESLYAERDWKEYCIYVHALKSSMLSIGAVPLSEMAKKLEAAAKAGDGDYILSAHESAMQEYGRVLDILKENFRPEAAQQESCTPGGAARQEVSAAGTLAQQEASVPGGAARQEASALGALAQQKPVQQEAYAPGALVKQDASVAGSAARQEAFAPGGAAKREASVPGAAASEKPELGMEEFSELISQLEDAAYTLDREAMIVVVDRLAGFVFHGHDLAAAMDSIRRKIDMEDYISAYDSVARMKDTWEKD